MAKMFSVNNLNPCVMLSSEDLRSSGKNSYLLRGRTERAKQEPATQQGEKCEKERLVEMTEGSLEKWVKAI